MKTRHPAHELFETLFNEAAKDPGPQLPTYFVGRNLFHEKCRRAGIDCPEGYIAATQWEEEIGLTEFAHSLISKYHREHGSDFTPMEKGAWRLRKKLRRSNV